METRDAILDSAQRLVQQRGYNGFSYADIADEVGIRKASLHHHFPTKAELGLALVARYTTEFLAALDEIEAGRSKADTKLTRYAALYRTTLVSNRMCLCGMLATEALTLDAALLPKLKHFFDRNVAWIAALLTTGKAEGRFAFSGTAADHARIVFSVLQGALMLARSTGDVTGFDRTISLLLKDFAVKD